MKSRVAWSAVGVAAIAVVLAAIYFGASTSAPPTSSEPGLLLSEVRFLPAEDRPAFVEILNAGSNGMTLDGVSLRSENGASFVLPAASIPAGDYLVVVFDDATGTEEGVVHAPQGLLAQAEGALRLVTPEGTADGIAWGVNRPAAVELCRGGRCAEPAPGSSIARLPGVVSALTTVAWAPLDPEHATPGEPNPQPAVSAFAVLPGTMFLGEPRFSWYGVPGAAHYRVEVARDETFSALVHEADVAATVRGVLEQLTTTGPELAPGDYFWRVQAIGAEDEGGAFSRPMPFTMRTRANGSPPAELPPGEMDDPNGAPPRDANDDPNAVCPGFATSPEMTCKELPVPVIRHQKDTQLLTLEAPNEEPPMGWDKPDVAGYPYCARAGVAMINAYYHAKLNIPGKLSQDRLGYEAFKDVLEFAEYDLPVTGIADFRTSERLLPLALGTRGEYTQNPLLGRDTTACIRYAEELTLQHCVDMGWNPESKECTDYQFSVGPDVSCPSEIAFAWGYAVIATVRREIDAGQPMIATQPGHLFLIVGYAQQAEQSYVVYQDEGGRHPARVDASGISTGFLSHWTGLVPVKLGTDEPSIAEDSDGDGVVDFDEEERFFETNPREADSDADGVKDKDEIHYSVWDADHGYHKSVVDLSESEFDSEVVTAAGQAFREPMEFFEDSDGGGCADGKENANRNGVRDPDETSNFDSQDDDCGPPPLGGHVQVAYAYSPTSQCVGRATIDARFTLEPQIVPETDIVAGYRATEMTYDIGTVGCDDLPGDHLTYTFDQGFHRAGTMALTEENLGFVVFTPSRPQFSMQLPYELTEIGAANTLNGSYTGNGGGPWPAETHVVFEPISIESDPTRCGDAADSPVRPDHLEFCVEPTPCADQANAPIECLSDPQRYAVLPFEKSFRWAAAPGQTYHIGDVSMTVRICEGCGSRGREE